MKIFEAGTDISASWTYSAVKNPNNTTLTFTQSTNTFNITGLTVDSGYLDITATRSGYSSITLRFSVTRLSEATDGISPKIVNLRAPVQLINYDKDGLNPSVTSISLIATAKNTGSTNVYYRFLVDDVYLSEYAGTGGTMEVGYSVPAAFFNTAKKIKVELRTAAGTTLAGGGTLIDDDYVSVGAIKIGVPATVYELEASSPFTINVNTNAITPASITYSAYFVTGSTVRSGYGSGTIVTERSNNAINWFDLNSRNQSTSVVLNTQLLATDRFVRATLWSGPDATGAIVAQEVTPLSVSGTNGVGSPGPSVKTATTYIYWTTAQATSAGIPDPTFTLGADSPYNFATGSLTFATNGGEGQWSQTPPTFQAGTASNNYWYKLITISQTNTANQVVTQGTTLLGTSFTNLVTFTSLTNTGTTQIDGGRITTGTLSANRIAAGTITTSKLTVVPVSLCPDPYFSDEAWWTATQFETNGWYFESDATMGVGKQASLWSGHPTNIPGTSRKHVWSGRVAAPSIGTTVRLRARMRNNSNQIFYVAVRFYNRLEAVLQDITLVSAAGSGIQDLILQGLVPVNAAWIRFIIYNDANNTFSGDISASAIVLDQAATADLIVDGAITAAKIQTNLLQSDNVLTRGLTVRDSAGNIVLSAGNALDFSRVGGSTKPADNATVGATWGTNIASQPTSLSGINSGEGTKLTGIETGATVGATSGTNLKDSNGRTVSDKRLLGNLLDSTTWVFGSTSAPTGFSQKSTSSTGSNYIESNTLPDGTQGLVWVAKAGTGTGATNPEGGWDTNVFNIDHTKMYRFSVWIRLAGSGSTGNYYLGPGDSTVRAIGGAVDNNPYFMATFRNTLEVGIWYLVLGYVYPSGYAGTQFNLGGTYRATDGVKIAAGTDFRWVVNQTQSWHRSYQYYTNSSSSFQLFWNPRVDLVDGTEPSLAELLSTGAASGRNPISTSNATTFISGAAIGSAQIGSINVAPINTAVNAGSTANRVEIDATNGGRIRIYDASGALRLRIGYLL